MSATNRRNKPGSVLPSANRTDGRTAESLLLGVPALDAQHRAVIALVEELRHYPNDTVSSEKVAELFASIISLRACPKFCV
jgi:hypothetical protein